VQFYGPHKGGKHQQKHSSIKIYKYIQQDRVNLILRPPNIRFNRPLRNVFDWGRYYNDYYLWKDSEGIYRNGNPLSGLTHGELVFIGIILALFSQLMKKT